MKFGLIFFSSTEGVYPDDKYKLLRESVRFADEAGFSSVWIPERHFTRDGWLYPNPAVLHAALARETRQIALRAGSVVMPLHDPIRVAEEWAMVDNLSQGRVGISFASGWHSNDFVFFPEKYADRHEEMYRGIATVRQLWSGESISVKGVDGREVAIRVFPTPVQQTLPVWVTAAGNPQTFARAGELGANLLTHLFNQSIEELAGKIAIYRESLARHGHRSNVGQVTVMLHTFVHSDGGTTFNRARQSFSDYLKSASYLLNSVAANRGHNVDFASLSRADLDDYMNFIFERLVSGDRVLFGTPQSCSSLVSKLAAIGVDELACQLDFLTEPDLLLESLPYLNQLKDVCQDVVFENNGFINPSSSDFLQPTDLRLGDAEEANSTARDSLDQISARCSDEVSTADFYDRFQQAGLQLNATFRGIESLRRCDGEALASVQLHTVNDEAHVHTLHPGVLDVCLQTLSVAVPSFLSSNVSKALYLFVGMSHFEIHGPLRGRFWCHAQLPLDQASSVDTFKGSVRLLNDEGASLLEITGLRLRRVENTVGIQAEDNRPLSKSQAEDSSVRTAILSSAGPHRLRQLETYLRERVAAVLRLSSDKVNIQEPLNNLGIDSLMAVELKKRIEIDLGVSIRIVYFLLGHNVVHLAEEINEQLSDAGETLNDDQLELRSPEELLAGIDELSDAEVDSLLASVIRNEEVKIEL